MVFSHLSMTHLFLLFCRRSKRVERGEETAQDVIVRELTQKRIEELKRLIKEKNAKLCELKKESDVAFSENPPPEFIDKLLQRKKAEEADAAADKVKHEEWLKEREAKILAAKTAVRQGLIRHKPLPGHSVAQETSSSDVHEAETSTPAHNDSSMSVDVESSADANSSNPAPPSTSPLLTSLLQSASGTSNYPRDSSSPTKATPFFSNTSPLASAARQLSTDSNSTAGSSPTKPIDKQLPISSPTLSKLLELPLSNTGNKLPPLPVVESTDHMAVESTTDRKEQIEEHSDKTVVSIKEEPMDTSEPSTQSDGDVSKKDSSRAESKSQVDRKSRGRKIVPVPSVSLTPTSTGLTTRRSGRIKGLRESESEQTFEKKPSLSDDPTDASASEESLDALVRAQASSSKAPSITDSVPNSPASSTVHSDEADSLREYRRWKTNIMMLWKQAQTHMHAHWFMAPVDEKEAEGYHEIVKRPMDLSTIKKKIENPGENGIRNTLEFQRDMMLMFENALMYNKKDHEVYKAAIDMRKEILDSIEDHILSEKNQSISCITPLTSVPPTSVTTTVSTPTPSTSTLTVAPTNTPTTTSSSSTSGKGEVLHPPKASRASRTVKAEEQKKQPGSATSTGVDATGLGRRRSRASTDEQTPTPASSTPVTRTMKKKTTN